MVRLRRSAHHQHPHSQAPTPSPPSHCRLRKLVEEDVYTTHGLAPPKTISLGLIAYSYGAIKARLSFSKPTTPHGQHQYGAPRVERLALVPNATGPSPPPASVGKVDSLTLLEVENIKTFLLDPAACPTSWPLLLNVRREARKGSSAAPVLL